MSLQEENAKPAGHAPEYMKKGKVASPDVDIFVNDEEILLVADLPGVSRENLSINIDNNTLSIEGSFAATFQGTPQRQEFGSVEYQRSFTLPKGLDVERARAELRHGILRLHLPKSAAGKPTQIRVTTA